MLCSKVWAEGTPRLSEVHTAVLARTWAVDTCAGMADWMISELRVLSLKSSSWATDGSWDNGGNQGKQASEVMGFIEPSTLQQMMHFTSHVSTGIGTVSMLLQLVS